MLASLPSVYRIALHADREDPKTAANLHEFVDAGVAYARGVLSVAHGQRSKAAQFAMPSVSEGVRWLRKADQLCREIPKIDPQWWDWYRDAGMPIADIEVGHWTGQLRGGAHFSSPPMPETVPSSASVQKPSRHIELAVESPRVVAALGAREINWAIARDQMDKLIELHDQSPCANIALEMQLRRLVELARENPAARTWMIDKRNMTRVLASLYMGYGIGRLALGTVEATPEDDVADREQLGAAINDLARRLEFHDVVASGPDPIALAATVDGISAEEAKARLADPIERLALLALRSGFLTAVAEEILLGGETVRESRE